MPRLNGFIRYLAGFSSEYIERVASRIRIRRFHYDANKVKQVALKYERKGFSLQNTIGSRGLTLNNCFNAVVIDSLYTIVLVPNNKEDINRLRITYSVGVNTVASLDPKAPQKQRQITDRQKIGITFISI